MNAETGAIDWYYQHLPCDDRDQDFVQERTLIDTVVNPDPEAVRWISPKLTGTAEMRKVVVVMGEPGGLFVNDRETGSTLATAGNVVFFGDLNRRLRAFDAETGAVLWETILGSQITGYPVTYAVDGRQYVTVPVGGVGNRLASHAPELEAPVGSNMLVTFTLP